MTETTARIRWRDDDGGGFVGTVGTAKAFTFTIWPPDEDSAWLLVIFFAGHNGSCITCQEPAAGPDELKRAAEDWLAGFVSSLGAVFPDGPTRPSRAWHADWAEVDRDQNGNAILRHKPTGGMYKILPAEEC